MKNLNNRIITTIQQHIPEEKNIVNVLIDILGISRESVYRRLRNEINFTLDEVSKIAIALRFSIDSIIEGEKTDNVVFNMHLLQNLNPFDTYYKKLEEFSILFSQINRVKGGKVRMALNKLPYYFGQYCTNLTKFRLYMWFYQMHKVSPNFSLKEFHVPKKIEDLQDKFSLQIMQMPDTVVIMDENVYLSVIKDIRYFYKRNLITLEDLEVIKKELLELISDTENYATTGINDAGSEITMYISSIDLDASYMHIESGDLAISKSTAFSISSLDSKVLEVCDFYKEWIDSLRKFSTHISQSSEIYRFKFFNEQRRLVNELLVQE